MGLPQNPVVSEIEGSCQRWPCRLPLAFFKGQDAEEAALGIDDNNDNDETETRYDFEANHST
jgi:hypothetical protein